MAPQVDRLVGELVRDVLGVRVGLDVGFPWWLKLQTNTPIDDMSCSFTIHNRKCANLNILVYYDTMVDYCF